MNIENFEILNYKNQLLLTYSIEDCSVLKEIDEVKITLDRVNNKYNLNIDGLNLSFVGIEASLLQDIEDKRVLIAGINPAENDFVEVALVKDINYSPLKKMKFGL